jgi:hypothetical protein
MHEVWLQSLRKRDGRGFWNSRSTNPAERFTKLLLTQCELAAYRNVLGQMVRRGVRWS